MIASSPARRFAGLLLLLAFPTLLHAQAHGLEVRPAERELFTVEPRQIVTVAFVVRNATGRRVELEPQLALPPGWRAITPEFFFELANGETAVRLVSFMIPETAREGDQPVTYAVRERQQPAVREAYTVRVRVLPLPKLQVLALEMPDFVIAGESYRASFLIRNTGNAPMQVEFEAQSALGGKADPQAGALKLEPGESKNVAIAVETPKSRRRERDHLTVSVKAAGTAVRDSVSSVTQVVPRIGADDAYHSLAAQAGLSYVTRDAGGKRSSGWQAQVSGFGTLDEANTQSLSFMLRAPDTRAQGSFGSIDEYWLDYSDANAVALTLGDRTYGLSPLTEVGRYGRGARAGYEKKNWGLSAYEVEDRFSATTKTQTGINGYYLLTEDTRVDANFLDKRDDFPATVSSVRSQTQWAPGLTSDVEHAQSEGGGERGQAFRGSFYDARNPVRYYGTVWRAAPGFRGYLRDQDYVSLGFDYPRPGEWGLRGYYRLQDNNLNIDPARAAPRERQASLGTERTLFSDTRVSLDYIERTRIDRRALSEFDLEHRSVRASVGQPIQNVTLLYSAELGQTRERVKNATFNTSLHMLTTYWKATERQSYSAYVFIDDNAFSTERQGVQTTAGVNGSYNVSSATFLNASFQRGHTSDGPAGASAGPTRGYDFSLVHERRNGDRVSLLARRTEGALRTTDMMLAYSIPFALPVGRKANMSSVRGRVLDAETGQGVPNVVLSLDGLAAVSGEKGEFNFPAVKAGNYHLSIDRANFGVGQVALGKMPLELVVAAHEPKEVEIKLIRSVAVHIRVSLYADATAPGPARGAGNVLVTLKNAGRVFRRLTEPDGSFRLAGLVPGRWIASIDDEAVPEGYEAQSRELVLEVTPGGQAEAEFRLAPRVRTIRMLPPLSAR